MAKCHPANVQELSSINSGTISLTNPQEEVSIGTTTVSRANPVKFNSSFIAHRRFIEKLCDSRSVLPDGFSSKSLLFITTYFQLPNNSLQKKITKIIFSIQTTY